MVGHGGGEVAKRAKNRSPRGGWAGERSSIMYSTVPCPRVGGCKKCFANFYCHAHCQGPGPVEQYDREHTESSTRRERGQFQTERIERSEWIEERNENAELRMLSDAGAARTKSQLAFLSFPAPESFEVCTSPPVPLDTRPRWKSMMVKLPTVCPRLPRRV